MIGLGVGTGVGFGVGLGVGARVGVGVSAIEERLVREDVRPREKAAPSSRRARLERSPSDAGETIALQIASQPAAEEGPS
jgi:hypothetical protein